MSPPSDRECCREILPSVSRTFALTIQVLPNDLRDAVTIAYLLCRLADTLEDATEADPTQRIDGLESLARSLAQTDPPSPCDLTTLNASLAPVLGLPIRDHASARLLAEREVVFRAYASLRPAQRAILSRWVQAMALGMSSFVARELVTNDARAAQGDVRFSLQTVEELRLYAYYVAGTVGHLLTDLFVERLGSRLDSVQERLRERAAPFGLGLQFTNILQDIADDRRRGWSYVPEDLAARHGTSNRNLAHPEQRQAGLRVVGELVSEAVGYLDQAVEFSLLLPRSMPRLRLFCLWPTFFALRTLGRICGEERVLAGDERVRITRRDVRGLMGATSAACLVDPAVEWLYRGERERLGRRLAIVAG